MQRESKIAKELRAALTRNAELKGFTGAAAPRFKTVERDGQEFVRKEKLDSEAILYPVSDELVKRYREANRRTPTTTR